MQITVQNHPEAANVQVVNPVTGEVLHDISLPPGKQVAVVAVNAHEPRDIQVTDVIDVTDAVAPTTDAAGEAPTGETPPETPVSGLQPAPGEQPPTPPPAAGGGEQGGSVPPQA